MRYEVKDGSMHEFATPYQKGFIGESPTFGKFLSLNGYIQSASVDEHIYHETLIQPAMCLHPNPKTVFIGGGGEGASIREVLKHPSVEKVIMCDLDQDLVELCAEHLDWSRGSYADPRVELVFQDAKQFLEDYEGTFDIVIMDINDPAECGPGIQLYTREFYQQLKQKLNPGFRFVTQSGPGGYLTHDLCCSVIHCTLQAAFDEVHAYSVMFPSFGDVWSFNIASDTPGLFPVHESAERIDAIIEARGLDLREYDGCSHRRCFSIPRYLRNTIAAETRVMTHDNYVFLDSQFDPIDPSFQT